MIRHSLIAASALTILFTAGALIGCDSQPEQVSASSTAAPSTAAPSESAGSPEQVAPEKKTKVMDMNVDEAFRASLRHKELVVLDDVADVPGDFQTALGQMQEQYQTLSQAFVADDKAATDAAALTLQKQVEGMESIALGAEAQSAWAGQRKVMLASLDKLSSADDIEVKRAHFSGVSEGIYSALKSFGGADQSLYVAYCPMAMEDEGAYWLAEKREIENPYMGQRMLRCGEVKGSI